MVFLTIAFVIGLALSRVVGFQRDLGRHAYLGEACHQAALSGLAVALASYPAMLDDPLQEVGRKIRSENLHAFELPDLHEWQHAGLKELAGDYPGLTLLVQGRLSGIEDLPVPDATRGEKRGDLTLVAEASWNGVKRRIEACYRFKFTGALPPLLPRFTLFVRDAARESFNNLGGEASGAATGGRPLVVVNGDPADPEGFGWIFLGGGRVCLNLARGEENFGEDFHLPSRVTRAVFFPDQDYALLNLNIGFYTAAGTEPYFARFPVKDAFKSSCLRLFGCSAASEYPSPTLVVGDVWRRYLQGVAIGPVAEERITRVFDMPWCGDLGNLPRPPGFPPFLFLSFKLYQTYMSQTREEPYNRSYDFIRCGRESPVPLYAKTRFAEYGPPYPLVDGEGFEFRDAAGAIHWRGRLRDFSLERALGSRIAYRYPGAAAFVDQRLARDESGVNILDISGINRIAGVVDLSRLGPLAVRGRGTLVAEGGLVLPAVRLVDPKRDLFVAATLAGDATLSGAEVEAGIAAPAGTVRIAAKARIRGFLAAGSLDPENLRGGATLAYDPRFNVARKGSGDGYAAVVSPLRGQSESTMISRP